MSVVDFETIPQRKQHVVMLLCAALFCCSALLIGYGCTPQVPTVEPIFPADYRSSFTVVRDCRNSVEHAATIRVWVNSIGVDAYLADANPLPEGTIVVKEEFGSATCEDDNDLIRWSVMQKETAGFDPQVRDWRFQEVASPSRTVTQNTKDSCVSCHVQPECLARDLMCTEP